jgi:diguanylate cyclase (GGDEF)-like protein
VLVLEQPFEEAFGPVLSVVTRVFVIDLCIILLFSFLAYQITATIVRPIEALSEGARKISAGELDVTLPDQKSQDEIGLLTRAFNEMTRKLRAHRGEIDEAQRRLVQDKEDLQRANEMLEQLSITDGLTRLHNHRFFQDHLTREIKRVNRTGEALAMLLIDIDEFKRLNDRLGHAAGDALLTGIAQVMNENIRDSDLLARYGGEEFVVVAAGTDLAGAMRLAEKLRIAVAAASFLVDETQPRARCTISVGVAAYKGNRKAFFQAADRALYRAKGEGKNRVVCADD